jgi:hypothetical protein
MTEITDATLDLILLEKEKEILRFQRKTWKFTPPEFFMGIVLSIVVGSVVGALMVFVVTNNTYSQQVKGFRSELTQLFTELGIKRLSGELPPAPPPKKEKSKG